MVDADEARLDVAVRAGGRRCLVVGGGPVAVRRIERLAAAGAQVTVISPTLGPLGTDSTSIRWLQREYHHGDVDGMWLVVAATGRFDVDSVVVAQALAAGILVNDATEAERGDISFPAVVTDGALTATFRTDGTSPALSAWIRRRFGDRWRGIGEVAELMGEARLELQASGRPTAHPGWDDALDDGLFDLVRAGRLDDARALLRGHLGLDPTGPVNG